MLTLLIRKMRNTKWMVLCMLIGFIMASAMLSTIPIYMNASLHRMLVKDMEKLQIEKDTYPGAYGAQASISMRYTPLQAAEKANEYKTLTSQSFDELGVDALDSKVVLIDEYDRIESFASSDDAKRPTIKLGSMSDIENHIDITDGRMYEKGQRSDGVYEVIATEQSLKLLDLATNTVYEVSSSSETANGSTIKIEIVGVFTLPQQSDSYWSEGLDAVYLSTVFMDPDTFLSGPIADNKCSVSYFSMRYSIDYQNMNLTDLESFNRAVISQKKAYADKDMSFIFPAEEILKDYASRSSQLKLILWLIQIPVMLMIVFYLFMVSRLNVEQEKNEIAVFKSRGASSRQIFEIYALQSLMLGVFTALIGPFVGLGLCRILGASNGFMEFVNRTALPVKLSVEAFLYSILAAAVFFITAMAPIVPATKTTIVEHKQKKARKRKRPLWEKLFLDIILIGGSVGWLYYYNNNRENLIASGYSQSAGAVNPMLFTASTAFILGCALLMVRIYPLIIRLIYSIGKKRWSPAAYVSLNNIGRSSTGRERFLMIFLILTVSLGIFFANTARALNRNAEEKVTYSVGCDAVVTEEWEAQFIHSTDREGNDIVKNTYVEPVFERFSGLEGVVNAARVYKNEETVISGNAINISAADNSDKKDTSITISHSDDIEKNEREKLSTNSVEGCTLMAVIPGEFSKVATSIDRLLPLQINNYLNGLSSCRSGVILSSSFHDKYDVDLGDKVTLSIGGGVSFEAVVISFVDYWPSINPYETPDFAVMNYNYVFIHSNIEPYEVWLDLDDSTTVSQLYSSMENSGIDAASLTSRSLKVVDEKNDPLLQGLNGALTLGFIAIMIMCIIGFLIYWILSIKGRTLQFGILRAMGMRFSEIIAMIVYEQLLVSAAAIAVAFVIGYYAGQLYIPLFESLYDVHEMVPTLSVVPARSDYLKLYVIILIMLLIGFTVLSRLISKINISKALKLGEE